MKELQTTAPTMYRQLGRSIHRHQTSPNVFLSGTETGTGTDDREKKSVRLIHPDEIVDRSQLCFLRSQVGKNNFSQLETVNEAYNQDDGEKDFEGTGKMERKR
jgi:hypothetical protein